MVNTPVFVDDTKSYTTYDQRSVDDIDDYKPPYNPSDELSLFFSTTEPFYPASYYCNYGQPNRGGYPVNTGTTPSDSYPPWRDAPPSSMRSSLPPPPEQIDQSDYRKQLRKMQRSMSPGSLQQLQPAAPEAREKNARPPSPPPPLPPLNSRERPSSHILPDGQRNDQPDMAYASLPDRHVPYLPPEMRGHLV